MLRRGIRLFKKGVWGKGLARKASSSLAVKVSGSGLSFLLRLLLVRLIGAKGFGEYIYVLTWMDALSIFGKLGFDVGSIRFVSAYRGKQEWGLLKGFLRRAVQITWASSCFSMFVVVITIGVLYSTGNIDQYSAFLFCLAAPNLLILSLIDMQSGILRGLGPLLRSLAPYAILYPLVIVAAVAFYVGYLRLPLTATVALIITLCVGIFVVLLQQYFLVRATPAELSEAPALFSGREWLRDSLLIAVVRGSQTLIRQADILVVGAMLGATQAGIYAVATRIVVLTTYGIEAVNTAATPSFARLHAQNRMDDLQEAVFQAARMSFSATLPVLFVAFFAAEMVLRLFGEEFTVGLTVFRILLIGQVVSILSGSNGPLLNMSGMHKELTLIVSGTALFDLCLVLLLTYVAGMTGAAVATSLSLVLRNALCVMQLWRTMRINPTIFSRYAWLPKES